jgi:hypothetical protein
LLTLLAVFLSQSSRLSVSFSGGIIHYKTIAILLEKGRAVDNGLTAHASFITIKISSVTHAMKHCKEMHHKIWGIVLFGGASSNGTRYHTFT